MQRPERIIVATGNRGKMEEITDLFSATGITLLSMRDFWKASVEIEETGETFMENAQIKADWVFRSSNIWALADDSGLMVDALDGEPGVRSARFAGAHGDSAANNQLLLSRLKSVATQKRTARFVCAAVLRINSDTVLRAEGVCCGRILTEQCGTGGFGYDPLFVPDGYDCTFAQLPADVKNRISHRAKALERIKEILDELIR